MGWRWQKRQDFYLNIREQSFCFDPRNKLLSLSLEALHAAIGWKRNTLRIWINHDTPSIIINTHTRRRNRRRSATFDTVRMYIVSF